jgi:hypothetical protein
VFVRARRAGELSLVWPELVYENYISLLYQNDLEDGAPIRPRDQELGRKELTS